MTGSFGPWTTSLGSQTRLSSFWRRRMELLPLLGDRPAKLSRRQFLGISAAGIAAMTLPTLQGIAVLPFSEIKNWKTRLVVKAFNPRCVAIAANGKLLAVGGGNGTVFIFDLASGREMARLEGMESMVTSVAFSPDSRMLAASGHRGRVDLWEMATFQKRARVKGMNDWVESVAFSSDGRMLAAGGQYLVDNGQSPGGGEVIVWDITTLQERLPRLKCKSMVKGVGFSPDGSLVVIDETTIKLWDSTTGRERLNIAAVVEGKAVIPDLRRHYAGISRLTISPDGKLMATGGGLAFPSAWDGQPGRGGVVTEMQYLPGDIKLWETETGKWRAGFFGHRTPITTLAFSPDGTVLASGSGAHDVGKPNRPERGVVKLWNVAAEKEIVSLQGHEDVVTGIGFAAVGRTLVTASLDGAVRVWGTD